MAESYRPGVSVSMVARRNDMNANLLFTWRRRYGKGAAGSGSGGLVPVVVEPGGSPATPTDSAAGSGRRVSVAQPVGGERSVIGQALIFSPSF